MATGIFRDRTEAEKKDFEEINRKDREKKPEWVIKKKVDDFDAKATKEHIPFCGRCARIDATDKIEKNLKEYERGGRVDDKMFDIDPAPYFDMNRFVLIGDAEAREKTMIGMQSVMAVVGKHYKFQCKVRGCGRSVFVPKGETPAWEVSVNDKSAKSNDEVIDKKSVMQQIEDLEK